MWDNRFLILLFSEISELYDINIRSSKFMVINGLDWPYNPLFLLEIPELLYFLANILSLFVFWRSRLLTSKLPTYPQHMLAHLKKQINGKEQLAMTQTTRSQPKKPIKIIPQYTATCGPRKPEPKADRS
ncbi:hypothetical protein YC2023_113496 [Brassica napus]|uniref:(rape) hypothetical protein n=1 Tax=Brassica napus TaxID=3708 RepID=A0A816IZ04_BRANA|nr:unnamed protein product [Brassica napus]